MIHVSKLAHRISIGILILGISLASISFAGCGRKTAKQSLLEANSTNIERLANLYVMFQAKNMFEGPADEAEFKEFIRNVETDKLAAMGIEGDIDELFYSELDGAPFKIRYGVRGSSRGATKPVIFETNSRGNGLRMVAFTSMIEKEVDDEEYEKLWDGEGDSDQAGSRE